MTSIISDISPHYLNVVCKALKAGELICAQTDTVYGIMCDPQNHASIKRIYEVKGRSNTKKIPLLVESIEAASEFCNFCHEEILLARKFWPGALTIIVNLRQEQRILESFNAVSSDDKCVAVRMPKSKLCLEMLHAFKKPIAATSANISGFVPIDNPKQISQHFANAVSYVITSSTTQIGSASTIVRFNKERGAFDILREGKIKAIDCNIKLL